MEESSELLSRIAEGDRRAFSTFFMAYSDEMHRYVFRCVNRRQHAEELVQEVFLRVFRKAHTFQGKSSAKTWLYRIAQNAVIDYYRKTGKERGTTSLEEEGEAGVSAATEAVGNQRGENVERALLQMELVRTVDQLYRQLPFDERLVFALRFFNERKNGEIQEITGFSMRKVLYKLKAATEQIAAGLTAKGFSKDMLNEL